MKTEISKLAKYGRNKSIAVTAALFATAGSVMAQGEGFISQDAATGVVSFSPDVLVLFLLGVVVAAITAGVALKLTWAGMKWAYRSVFGA